MCPVARFPVSSDDCEFENDFAPSVDPDCVLSCAYGYHPDDKALPSYIEYALYYIQWLLNIILYADGDRVLLLVNVLDDWLSVLNNNSLLFRDIVRNFPAYVHDGKVYAVSVNDLVDVNRILLAEIDYDPDEFNDDPWFDYENPEVLARVLPNAPEVRVNIPKLKQLLETLLTEFNQSIECTFSRLIAAIEAITKCFSDHDNTSVKRERHYLLADSQPSKRRRFY